MFKIADIRILKLRNFMKKSRQNEMSTKFPNRLLLR